MEIETMLVLSTAHLTQDTCGIYLSNIALGLERGSIVVFDKRDVGFFVYVPADPEATEGPDVPLELRSACHVARREGCRWIMYDKDGPELDELPVYSWGDA